MPMLYLRSLAGGLKNASLYASVPRYCMFIGHPRSGHSLVGSLLDAHPEVVIAHELDVLRYLGLGFSKNQIYDLIIKHDKAFTETGRQWTGYDYAVPGQWQGRFESLRVIGDKKGGVSTMRLRQQPALLDKLERTIKVPVMGIHVQRNPYDNIATISRKDNKSLEEAITFYFELQDTNRSLEERFGERMISFRQENMIQDPERHLTLLAEHLGVRAPEDWLRACAGVIFDSPNKSRNRIEWTADAVDRVADLIAERDELEGYSFED